MKKLIALPLLAAGMIAHPAMAEKGDTYLRLRGILVAPNESSGSVLPAFPGEKVSVDNSAMPEVDVTYMVTDHIGVELIASSTKHSASGRTGTTGGIGKLASTWVLPPTLTVQYHPVVDGPVRPYVGAGVNYTLFYAENASKGLEAAVGKTKVSMSDSLGYALQAGVDIDLNKQLFLNLDAKYLDISTVATLRTTAAGTQKVKVDLNPIVFGVGVGFRL